MTEIIANSRRKGSLLKSITASVFLDSLYTRSTDEPVLNLEATSSKFSPGYYCSLVASARGYLVTPSIDNLLVLQHPILKKSVIRKINGEIWQSTVLRKDRCSATRFSIVLGQSDRKSAHWVAEIASKWIGCPLVRVLFDVEQQKIRDFSLFSWSNSCSSEARLIKTILQKNSNSGIQKSSSKKRSPNIALMYDPEEKIWPSSRDTIRKFQEVAGRMGLRATLFHKSDIQSVANFDGLFLRETPYIDGLTYAAVSQAEQFGMPVLDTSLAIERCRDKIYLEHFFSRNRVNRPQTIILSTQETVTQAPCVDFPLILKTPDGGFGQGCTKVHDLRQLNATLRKHRRRYSSLIAQRFTPTDFDWRVATLDGELLFAAKYYMISGDWRVVNLGLKGEYLEGEYEAVPIKSIPIAVKEQAILAASVVPEGLLGIDLKQVGDTAFTIEVNPNPDIHLGSEDAAEGEVLYERIWNYFLDRIA